MRLKAYIERLTAEVADGPFGNEMLREIVTEAAWRAGGCICTRRGAPLDDGKPVYPADVTCPVHPVRCRTDDAFRHDSPTVLVDGEPRCDFCRQVIGDRAEQVVSLPT